MITLTHVKAKIMTLKNSNFISSILIRFIFCIKMQPLKMTKPIYISKNIISKHILIIGTTGKGKSSYPYLN